MQSFDLWFWQNTYAFPSLQLHKPMTATSWAIRAATRRKPDHVPGLLRYFGAEMEASVTDSHANVLGLKDSVAAELRRLRAVSALLDENADLDSIFARLNGSRSFAEQPDSVSTTLTVSDTADAIGASLADVLVPAEASKDAISPYKETYAPVTSPNVDLSFIAVAHSLRHAPSEKALSAASDDSFQAISTAIRKSIAGKTSMLNYSHLSHDSEEDPLPVRAPRKSTLNPEWARKSILNDQPRIPSEEAHKDPEVASSVHKTDPVIPSPGPIRTTSETTGSSRTRPQETPIPNVNAPAISIHKTGEEKKRRPEQETKRAVSVSNSVELPSREAKMESKPSAVSTLNSVNDTSFRPIIPERKRSSVFVSLPSREPLIIPTSPPRQSFKVKKPSKLQDKLGVAALYDASHSKPIHSGTDSGHSRYSTKEPAFTTKGDETLRRHTTVERNSDHQDPARSFPHLKASTAASDTIVKSVNLANTLAKSLRNITSSNIPKLKTELRAKSRTPSPEKSPTLAGRSNRSILTRTPRMPSSYSTWTTNSGSPRREEKKPIREASAPKTSIFSNGERSRSPTRYNRVESDNLKASPVDFRDIRQTTLVNAESDLINRLTLPTSSSAQKVVQSPVKQEPKKLEKAEKMDATLTRNRFLTTTLNPDNPPVFHSETPIKPPTVSSVKKPEEREKAKLPSVRKKTIMAQRNEAAADRPKQKIYINLNRTTNTHLPPRIQSPKEEVIVKPEQVTVKAEAERKSKRLLDENISVSGSAASSSKSRRAAHGNAVPLPDAARGKFVEKRRKVETPVKHRTNGKYLILPNTPYSLTADSLPDIPSESEDINEQVPSWATTPELRKQMEGSKHVDPVSAFGTVPKLNLEEIFGSVVLKLRGRYSYEIEKRE